MYELKKKTTPVTDDEFYLTEREKNLLLVMRVKWGKDWLESPYMKELIITRGESLSGKVKKQSLILKDR